MPRPPPEDLPDPGIEPMILVSPALADGFFTTSDTWHAQYMGRLASVLKEKIINTNKFGKLCDNYICTGFLIIGLLRAFNMLTHINHQEKFMVSRSS